MYRYETPNGILGRVDQPGDLIPKVISMTDYMTDQQIRDFLMELINKLVEKNILSFQDILDITLGGGRKEVRHD